MVEFIHTATLLHDDVVDESELRRGKQTANALFGNAASVLVGDFLYSRAFQMMVGVDKMRVMQILSDATNVIAEGEVLQLLNMHDPDVDEARYLQVIRYKTAKLFEAARPAGRGARRRRRRDRKRPRPSYGRRIGTAFQIDRRLCSTTRATPESMGKNVGDDLREGKPTLPLIYAHEARHAGAARSSPAKRSSKAALTEFETIFAAITRTGALDHTPNAGASAKPQAAAHAIASFPDSIYKESSARIMFLLDGASVLQD